MLPNLNVTIVTLNTDIQQILMLQSENLENQITSEEAKNQGFVTVVHDLELLCEMNEVEPSVIAKYNEKVVGYCLSMPRIFKSKIAVLKPMFEQIDRHSFEGKALKDCNYLIMGQVCVAKGFRGMGIFDKMYAEMQKRLSTKYDFLITEVASRNIRSLRAHQRVGFEILYRYADDLENWELLIWNWRKKTTS